jgi:serine/threonine-protein kinase
MLAAAILAAVMPLLALFLLEITGNVDANPGYYVDLIVSGAFAVVFAYMGARVIYRLGREVAAARELGSYRLEERLGQGGMGEVWRAQHRMLARPAAIKLIHPALTKNGGQGASLDLQHRFEREAQVIARLRSPHTVNLFDFGLANNGAFYYAMELLEGLDADRLVRRFGPVPAERAIYLLRQVCHSLSEAESCGLVHRDIKPANIHLGRLGLQHDFVKVLDFGLVKHTELAQGGTMLTMEGATAGTPAYMAPEIALGQGGVDGRADIYSLACVAYYLLTGQPVFSADSAVATALAHVKDEPIPPSGRSEFEIPRALDALILECLAKDPAKRPQTAAAFGERLAAAAPENAWTPEAAHAWWELHRVRLTGAEPASDAPPEREGTVLGHPKRPRCWPRLDRTPVTNESLHSRS